MFWYINIINTDWRYNIDVLICAVNYIDLKKDMELHDQSRFRFILLVILNPGRLSVCEIPRRVDRLSWIFVRLSSLGVWLDVCAGYVFDSRLAGNLDKV